VLVRLGQEVQEVPRRVGAGLLIAAGLAACGGGDVRPESASATPARTAPAQPGSGAGEAAASATPRSRARTAARTRPRLARTPGRTARVRVLATGLQVPWDLAFLPGGRALLTERPGRVRLVTAAGRVRRAPVARVPNSARGEGGLLGIALDPDFARGRRFAYLYVTTASGMEVQRWRWTGRRLVRAAVVLDGIAAGSIHDSGRLRFGPDRALYVATGDAGRRELAQRRSSLNGKFLRLTPRQYRSRTNRPEVFSLGNRNPQGLAWQPGTNRLVATEHGPSGFDGGWGNDEVNVIRRGGNYGWPAFGPRQSARGFVAPVRLYPTAIAPSGAAFVTRPGSSWTGDFVFAALKGEALHRLRFRGRRVVGEQVLLRGRFGRLRAVVEAPDGALWVTTSNRDTYGTPRAGDDRLLRVVPPAR
jgi:glucose/arabinose dehydrogenase